MAFFCISITSTATLLEQLLIRTHLDFLPLFPLNKLVCWRPMSYKAYFTLSAVSVMHPVPSLNWELVIFCYRTIEERKTRQWRNNDLIFILCSETIGHDQNVAVLKSKDTCMSMKTLLGVYLFLSESEFQAVIVFDEKNNKKKTIL